MKRCLAVFSICLSSVRAFAGDFESVHAFNGNLQFRHGWTLLIHSRVRFNHNISDFYQARFGPVVTWQATPKISWQSGYYYAEQETASHRLFDLQRAFTGAQYRLFENSKMALDTRFLYERNFGAPTPDYNRCRSRLLWASRRKGLRPTLSGEANVIRQIWFGYYTAGLQWTARHGTQYFLGYEYRQSITGQTSHLLSTTVQFQLWKPHGPEAADRNTQGSSKTASTGK